MTKAIILAAILFTAGAFGQQPPPVESPLLDKLVGNWVATGNIGKQAVTHYFDVKWVLDHHYVLVHEVSREKNQKGEPQYEASVYVSYDDKAKQYRCAWLDVFGGLDARSIGVASAKENEIAFVFKDEAGAIDFRNDWVYDPKTNSWQQMLDNVVNGQDKPFARLKLTRSNKNGAQ